MNHILKLRCYTHFVRKFHGVPSTHTSSNFMHYYYPLGLQHSCMTSLHSIPNIYSYYPVREYAKRPQGKIPKNTKGKVMKVMKLTDEEMADVIDIDEYKEELHQVGEKLKKDYVENLSIRSAASNITNIIVKIDGGEYSLNELAVISKKNPNLIAINMSDFPEAIKPAIHAITDSGSGLNPQQEGTMIYISVPKLTREHRENLAKNAKSLFIKAKEEIRLIQNSFVKEAKNKTDLSEDLVFNASNQIMAMAEQCSSNLEKVMKDKQKELLGDS